MTHPYRASRKLARIAPPAPWWRVLLSLLFRDLRGRQRQRAARLAIVRRWPKIDRRMLTVILAGAKLRGANVVEIDGTAALCEMHARDLVRLAPLFGVPEEPKR